MKIALLSLLVLASCGGKSTPAPVGGGDPGREAAKIPDGIHGCTFTVDGTDYGQHRCDVVAGAPRTLEKKSGMELFSATMSESADGIVLDAKGGCGDMHVGCNVPFTVKLTRDGGTWSGPVVSSDTSWWLHNATLSIADTADYGGDSYGGAAYGGE